MSSDEQMRRRARQIAEARYGFRWHLPIYLIVNAALVLVWAATGGFFWPVFPIFFWGLGVVAHYMAAYRSPRMDWIDQETEKIIKEQQEKNR